MGFIRNFLNQNHTSFEEKYAMYLQKRNEESDIPFILHCISRSKSFEWEDEIQCVLYRNEEGNRTIAIEYFKSEYTKEYGILLTEVFSSLPVLLREKLMKSF